MTDRPITFGEAALLEHVMCFDQWRDLMIAVIDMRIAEINLEETQEELEARTKTVLEKMDKYDIDMGYADED